MGGEVAGERIESAGVCLYGMVVTPAGSDALWSSSIRAVAVA